jgi:hypothetical protein
MCRFCQKSEKHVQALSISAKQAIGRAWPLWKNFIGSNAVAGGSIEGDLDFRRAAFTPEWIVRCRSIGATVSISDRSRSGARSAYLGCERPMPECKARSSNEQIVAQNGSHSE